jgi:hypothetical protein
VVFATHTGWRDDETLDYIWDHLHFGTDQEKAINVPVDQGRVLLYSTNPVYRWQNHGEFNMLFNAIMNHDDLGAKRPVTWTPPMQKVLA